MNSIFIDAQKHCGWWVKALRLSKRFGGISKQKATPQDVAFVVLLRIEVRLSQAEFTCLTEIYKVWSTCVLIEIDKRDGETWCVHVGIVS